MAFKIIVCAKQVPDTNVIKINPKTGTSNQRRCSISILNHDDANALEEALKIKDKYDDVHCYSYLNGTSSGNRSSFRMYR